MRTKQPEGGTLPPHVGRKHAAMTMTYTEEKDPISLRPLNAERPWRFSWGAVFAGAVISLGIWMLLHLLGIGVGLTAINPNDLGSVSGIGMTTGIWSLIVPIIAMFLGGFAAAKVAGPVTRLGGVIHGAALWSLSTLAATFLLVWLVSSLLGGVARLGGQAVSAAGQALQAAPTGALSEAGLSADDLLVPVNERLQASGNPPITSEQLGAAVQEALRAAIRQGEVDQELLTNALAQNTALSATDAREIVSSVEQTWNQQLSALSQQAQQVGGVALQAAETTGKGMLGLFFAMLLGLIAAIGGTIVGVTRTQRAVAERATARAERWAGRHVSG